MCVAKIDDSAYSRVMSHENNQIKSTNFLLCELFALFLSSLESPPSNSKQILKREARLDSNLSEKMAQVLFEDIFQVKRIDPDGKKFDKVSRIEAKSQQFDMYMQLDINTEIYPMKIDEKFTMALAPTLNLDGTPDTGFFLQTNKKTLADKYEYVMHGKLFKISEDSSGGQPKVEMYASFGGLLMLLKGDPSNASTFELDQKLFLLIRKV
ncbi:hypothetical protein LUZ60_003142 [Juncus effusus]|nr:hypothetical protein LUZ60_003142 [Juncus effusus]